MITYHRNTNVIFSHCDFCECIDFRRCSRSSVRYPSGFARQPVAQTLRFGGTHRGFSVRVLAGGTFRRDPHYSVLMPGGPEFSSQRGGFPRDSSSALQERRCPVSCPVSRLETIFFFSQSV